VRLVAAEDEEEQEQEQEQEQQKKPALRALVGSPLPLVRETETGSREALEDRLAQKRGER
jgi:hypothetical protein